MTAYNSREEVEILKYNGDDEAWKAMRATGIGSSDIPTILGLNQYCTPYQLWLQKTGQAEGNAENHFTQMGHNLEDAVAITWSQESGKEIIKSSAGNWQFRVKAKPWMLASPDRLYWKGENHNANDWSLKGILECKSTQSNPEKNDLLLKKWYSQTQWQLACSPIDEVDIAWIIGTGFQFGKRHYDINTDFVKQVVEIADEFFNKNIKEMIAPELINASDVAAMFPTSNGEEVEASDDVFEAYNAYVALDAQIKTLQDKQSALKDKLVLAIGDNETLTHEGSKLITYKSQVTNRFDSTRFKKEQPEVYAEFLKESTSRVFKVK